MTALKKYQRLEASALWRAAPQEQRREVVVSIGDATLVISDLRDRALTHWSLAAVERLNPDKMPALFAPNGDPGETLELTEDEAEMVGAIETLRRAVDRTRPHPGRLRRISGLTFGLAVGAAIAFWVPGALTRHAARTLPDIRQQQIGSTLRARIEHLTGTACATRSTAPALLQLAQRTGVRQIAVLPDVLDGALALPGGITLIGRDLIEDHDQPEVAAGYILAEAARMGALGRNTGATEIEGALAAFLRYGGAGTALRLLTTGRFDGPALQSYAEFLLTSPRQPASDDAILSALAAAGVSSRPYAFARDITGESVLPLIEGDPLDGNPGEPIMADGTWVGLQSICES